MTELRFGIIGCGKIAINHARALQNIDNVVLAAVADVDASRVRAFARKHAVPRSHTDVDEMLSSGLDAVTICSPLTTH
jgi:predicted dehydrogenase